jgi:hypothetical protein
MPASVGRQRLSAAQRPGPGDDRDVLPGNSAKGTQMSRILLAGAVSAVIGIGLLFPGSASAADTWSYQAALNPVAANLVSGNGASWITVTGTTAEVQIQVNGLLDNAPHAQSIRIDAQGSCPTQGSPTISTTDGQPSYGTVGAALTTDGDSSPAAALALGLFPSAGSYTYTRTIEVDPAVVAALQGGTAVLVVQGVDYNNNGSYDGALGASELDPNLPAEATDPALCGTFVPMQMAGVPDGAANTGGGSTATTGGDDAAGVVGAAALLLFGGAVLAGRRRGTAR